MTEDPVILAPPYKLAVARFGVFFITSFCGSIMAALAGNQWATCDAQTRFLIIVGIVSSLSSQIGSFIDKSMSNISDTQKKNEQVKARTADPFRKP